MHDTTNALKALSAAAILCAAQASQATITSTTSATTFANATASGPKGVDNFTNLTINTFLTGPLSRTAGVYNYSATAGSAAADAFYVLPNAGNPALSMNVATDPMIFTLTGASATAIGGNFFGSNNVGEVAGGTLTIVARDMNNNTLSSNFVLSSSTANFIGFLSDAPLLSLTVTAVQPANPSSLWASVDNLTIAQVPEPVSAVLMLGGLGIFGLANLRRPRSI